MPSNRIRSTCAPRRRGRSRPSTTSPGATRTTSRTSTSRQATSSTRSAGAYDLLYDNWTPGERARIRQSLERHAGLVYDAFAPKPNRRMSFTQNHNFIPTAGLAVTALALMGESADAPKWAALARAHHHACRATAQSRRLLLRGRRVLDLLRVPWLVHFPRRVGACHGARASGPRPVQELEVHDFAHSTILPDGQTVFDFGDIWQGPAHPQPSRARLRSRISGRHAQEQLQPALPRGGAVPGPAGAGRCGPPRGVRPHEPGRVVDAAVAGSVTGPGAG